jgi:hypothetical protein
MSNPLLIRYNLDPTGVSSNNLVQGEQHTLVSRLVRTIVPTYGAYFAESMIITDLATNKQLVRGAQWYPGELYDVPTAKYGKDIYALLVITDTTVSNNVSIQYQAIGGEYSSVDPALLQLLDTLSIDNRPIAWPNIINKPEQFPPSMHLHDIGDVYGFEYVTHALERIRQAIELGDQVSHDQIYKYIDNKFILFAVQVQALITAYINAALTPKVNYLSEDEIYFLYESSLGIPTNDYDLFTPENSISL